MHKKQGLAPASQCISYPKTPVRQSIPCFQYKTVIVTTTDNNDGGMTMEVDTGAAVSLINEETVNNSPFLMCLPLQQMNVTLCAYIGQPVSVLGQLLVTVQHDEAQETMPLQVVKVSDATLLGRD